MSKIKYKMGDEVAHIDNLTLKMRVRKVVYVKNLLSHINCDWWHGDEKLEENFHSNELILWSIAKQGQEYVDSYIKTLEIME